MDAFSYHYVTRIIDLVAFGSKSVKSECLGGRDASMLHSEDEMVCVMSSHEFH